MKLIQTKQFALFLAVLMFVGFSTAWANLEQFKNYKAAFPDEKAKCSTCHVEALPKKEAGQHELNAYGQKVLGISKPPTADTYKTAGKAS